MPLLHVAVHTAAPSGSAPELPFLQTFKVKARIEGLTRNSDVSARPRILGLEDLRNSADVCFSQLGMARGALQLCRASQPSHVSASALPAVSGRVLLGQ